MDGDARMLKQPGMDMKNHFKISLLALALVSCGALPENKENFKENAEPVTELGEQKADPNIDQEVLPPETAAAGQEEIELKKKLIQVVDQALASDQETQRFLASDLYLKASAASNMGDYGSAEILLRQIYRLSPLDNFLGFRFGVELIRTGQLEEAAMTLQEVFERQKGKDEKTGLLLAGTYSSLEKNDRAQSIYKKVLGHFPKSEDACIFLVKSYSLSKKENEAQHFLTKCENALPRSGVFSYYKGKMAMEKGQKNLATQYFSQALAKDPSYSQAVIAKGLLLEEKSAFKEAQKLYLGYLKKFPEETTVLSRFVNLLFAQEKFIEVIPYAETLSSLDPEDLNLKVKLGILYTEVQKYELAKVQFEDILRAVPDSDKVLYYLGALNQQTQDFEAAQNSFQKIAKDSPLYPDAIMQVASIKSVVAMDQRLKGDRQGEDNFLNFIDGILKSEISIKIELSLLAANYFENHGENQQAITIMEKVRGEANFGENHTYYFASLLEKEKRFEESNRLIMDILEKQPENPNAYNFLGYSLLMRGQDLNLAKEYIMKAVSLAPQDGFIRDSLGWYYFINGEFERAAKELETAFKLVPNDATISKHLAMAYEKIENYRAAKKYYVEALKNSQQPMERDDILRAVEELEKQRSPASSGKN